jgi:2-methylcitrate dehydratase PrpD
MAAAAATPLPAPALEQTKLHILDTLGAMVSGATLPPGKLAIAFARGYGGEKVATVVASDVVVGPIEAALANGILAHSDETDDSHAPSLSHPGAPVVAATLAAAEKFGVDGMRFVNAVALGYDIGTRMTMTLGPDFQKAHRSTHAVAGGFGTAAAAGCCAGLSEQQMRWLMDYAAQQSAGIASWQRDRDHIEKAFVFAGMSARNGVNAALLVQAGWTASTMCCRAPTISLPPMGRRPIRTSWSRHWERGSRSNAPTSRSGRSAHRSRRRWMRCGI